MDVKYLKSSYWNPRFKKFLFAGKPVKCKMLDESIY